MPPFFDRMTGAHAVGTTPRDALAFLLLFAGHAALAAAGRGWMLPGNGASPVWPAAGLALAGLLWGGVRLWPAVALGGLAAALLDGSGMAWWLDALIAMSSALVAAACADGLRRHGFDIRLRRAQDALALLSIGGALGSALSATCGTGLLLAASAIGPPEAGPVWLRWWLGDLTGVVVVAPLVLAWRADARIGSWRRTLHFLVCTAATTGLAWLIFVVEGWLHPMVWYLFAPLVWAALAFNAHSTLPVAIVAACAIAGTGAGTGPFGARYAGPDALLMLQLFITVMASTTLLLAVVAEERRGKEELRASEAMLRLALKAARAGGWQLDLRNGRLASMPESFTLLGAPPGAGDWSLERFVELIHPDDRADAIAGFDAAVARGGSFELAFRVVRPVDGAVLWLSSVGEVEPDDAGRPAIVRGVNQDISARRRAEEALAEANRRKDEFIAILAHELRNPLAPIRTGVELLQLAPDDADGVMQVTDVMARQVGHMVRLIDDLLDVSRITRGLVELHREDVDVRAIVDSAVEASQPLVRARGHALVVRMPDAPVLVHADPTRGSQIVGNLLNNAAKYTPDGGRLTLDVTPDGPDGVCIAVGDDGIGIAPDMLERIFDLFTQAGPTRERMEGGLGIGLSITRRLVEMHGGRIEAESPGPGRGSTFRVWLPRARAGSADPGTATAHHPARAVAARAHHRVLIVDDNADAADSLARMLGHAGHDVRTAPDGAAALSLVARTRPDVVLLDLGMPGLDGLEVARRLRAQASPIRPRLIALTGWGSEADRRRALDAGFDLQLTKPAAAETVLDAIERLGTP